MKWGWALPTPFFFSSRGNYSLNNPRLNQVYLQLG